MTGKKTMTRSENMGRIKGKNTQPEIYLREMLWNRGFRYLKNYEDLPGKPDMYIIRYNTAIFVNGCFWHMHEGCKDSGIPKTNREFWLKKLTGNVERDKKNYELLIGRNIKVIVVWECTVQRMKRDPLYCKNIMDGISEGITGENGKMFMEF